MAVRYGKGLMGWAAALVILALLVHWIGTDTIVRYRADLWFYLQAHLTLVLLSMVAALAVGIPDYVLFGIEETNTLTDATPRTRGSFSAAWSNDHWSLSTRVNRYGSATRVFNFGDGYIPRQTYQAEWQLDAEVEYRITPRWSVAIGGQNLTGDLADGGGHFCHGGGGHVCFRALLH